MARPGSPSPDPDTGAAGGSRRNMPGPQPPQATANRLHDVDLETRGEYFEDERRDRDSNGSGRYDDSVARRRSVRQQGDRAGTARGD